MRFQTKGVRISEGLDYCTVVVGLCVCVCVCVCVRACVRVCTCYSEPLLTWLPYRLQHG